MSISPALDKPMNTSKLSALQEAPGTAGEDEARPLGPE